MVLQSAYKARASRKYNAARGGGTSGRGQAETRGRGRGRGRGGPRLWEGRAHDDDPEGSGDGSDTGTEEEIDDEGVQEDDPVPNKRDANFPALPLAKAASAGPSTASPPAKGRDAGEKGKYSRRKLGDNSWRYEEEEVDPYAEDEAEPEVDVSSLIARVAALGTSAPLGAGPDGQGTAPGDTADDIEADIDRSLSYLHSKQREREKGKGRPVADMEAHGPRSDEAGQPMDPAEIAAMRKEKENAEALRTLKERFLGRQTGERVRTAVTRRIPGAAAPPSSHTTAGRLATTKPCTAPEVENVDDFLESLGTATGRREAIAPSSSPGLTMQPRDGASALTEKAHGGAAAMRPYEASQTGKPKPKVEHLESFLDGMLG